jgi:nucleotide-binding universal stress UspA family protein
MFQRALICTDLKDSLDRLTQVIPALAAAGLQELMFFHTVPLLEDREIPKENTAGIAKAKAQLSEALSPEALAQAASVAVKVVVESGRPVDNILHRVKSYAPDVMLLGMPVRSQLQEQLFGSTTMGLIKHLQTPLLILRPPLIATYRRDELSLRAQSLWSNLLIPYDGSTSAQYLVQQIQARVESSAPSPLKHCVLCWVIDDGLRKDRQSTDMMAQAEATLAETKVSLGALNIEVTTEIRQGSPVAAILASAQANDISAIAVCSSHNSLLKWSVPSFTNAILRESWHPILHFPN